MDCESQLQLQQQYRITEFGRSAEFPRILWNSAATAKFRGPRKTVVPSNLPSATALMQHEIQFLLPLKIVPGFKRHLKSHLIAQVINN